VGVLADRFSMGGCGHGKKHGGCKDVVDFHESSPGVRLNAPRDRRSADDLRLLKLRVLCANCASTA
jgi:hypothetical protein